jgi:tripartite-type tricarboxylate transporter receptor subunit TctC
MAMVGIATALPHVKAGKIKPIGVTGATRSSLLPDIPTLSEAGVKGYEFAGWYGIFAPAGTPRSIVLKINADTNKTLQQPDAIQRLAAMGFEPQSASVDEFARYFREEVLKWRNVINAAGIAAN